MHMIYVCNYMYMQFTRLFLSLVKVGLACETRDQHIICYCTFRNTQLTFLECAHFTKSIVSALLRYQTYCILVEHNLYIDHYHTTAYIVVANLASWERGYANCNSTYLAKASTLSGSNWVQGLNYTHSRMRSLPAGTPRRGKVQKRVRQIKIRNPETLYAFSQGRVTPPSSDRPVILPFC